MDLMIVGSRRSVMDECPRPPRTPRPCQAGSRLAPGSGSRPGRLRSRRLELADDGDGVLRLGPDGVVRIHIGGPDPSVLVDDVAGGHRQAKGGLVMELVERGAKRRV